MDFHDLIEELNSLEEKEEQKLLEMAMPLRKAKITMDGLSEPIKDNYIKCLLFGDKTGDLKHWVRGISDKLSICNNITLKPKNDKINSKYIDEFIFSPFFDTPKDAYAFITVFNDRKDYLQVEVTDKLCEVACKYWKQLREECMGVFSSNDVNVSKETFEKIVGSIVIKAYREAKEGENND